MVTFSAMIWLFCFSTFTYISVFMDQPEYCERVVRNDDMAEGDMYEVMSDSAEGKVSYIVVFVVLVYGLVAHEKICISLRDVRSGMKRNEK